MGARISLEDYKIRIANIHPNIEVLDEFVKETGKTKKVLTRFVKCRCKTDGYEWDASLSNLSHGTGCPKCSGVYKPSIEEVKAKLKEINENIAILSDTYINNRSKLECVCLKDGYRWKASWDHLERGEGCPECVGKRRDYTIDDIKNKISKNNTKIEILSNVYEGSAKKIKAKCLVDGYEWDVTPSSLLMGSGCPKCAGNIKYTIEEIKRNLKDLNKDIIILSDTYTGAKDKLKCQCLKHDYIWDTTWGTLSKGNGCPVCLGLKFEYTLENFQQDLKNRKIEVLPSDYVNAKTKMKFKCLVCGNTWMTVWGVVKSGSGCPECAKLKCKKENHPNWKGGITPLHIYLRNTIAEWKKIAMRESGYKCIATGKKFDVIHHVYGFDLILEETMKIVGLPIYEDIGKYTKKELQLIEDVCMDLHNKYPTGVCLCHEEHFLFHHIYGKGGNTVEQFEEFLKTRGGAIDGATN